MKQNKIALSCIVTICLIMTLFLGTGKLAKADTNAGLVAHYTFDDSLKDTSGNSNDGTAVGKITYVNGILGKAAAFDDKSYIEVQSSESLKLSNKFSISAWIYKDFDVKHGDGPIVTKLGDGQNVMPYALFNHEMCPNLEVESDIGNNNNQSAHYIDMHKWTLLTVTYNGSEVNYYVDGQNTKENLKFEDQAVPMADGKLLIGMINDGEVTHYYKGYIDDLRIYNVVIPQDDVTTLYNQGAIGFNKHLVNKVPALIAYYKFNSNLSDSSGYNNNAKVIGSEKYDYAVQNKGLKFDGTNHLEVQDSDSIDVDKGITISVWTKLSDFKGDDTWPIVERLSASMSRQILPSYSFYTRFFHGQSGRIGFNNVDYLTNSPNGQESIDMDAKLGNWCMLTVTFNGHHTTYYINGEEKIKGEPVGGYNNVDTELNPILHSGDKLIIGKMGEKSFFRGIMDELRVYNYVMSSTDIHNQYKYRDNLVVKYPVSNNIKLESGLNAGDSMYITVDAVSPENVSAAVPLASVRFSSSNQSIFTIDQQGLVKAKAKSKSKSGEKETLTITVGANSISYPVIIK